MEEDVLNALLTRAAYLPGGFDREGRILVVVSIINDLQLWNKNSIEICISYLKRSLSSDLLSKGIAVIVDAQRCSSRITRTHSRTIYSLFGDTPITLFLVRSEGFWEKHVEPCAKSHTKEEPIVVSKSRISKYIDTNNLPEELGGTLTYNHDLWLQNRKAIDEFRKTFDRTIRNIENLHVLLSDSKSLRPSDADQELKRCTMIYSQVQTEIADTIDSGNRLLTRITDSYRLQPMITPPSLSPNIGIATTIAINDQHHLPGTNNTTIPLSTTNNQHRLPPDMANERARTEQLLIDIQKKQTDIRSAWRDLEHSLHEAREVAALEEGVAFVTNWILNTAEQMLNRNQTIGCDVKACEELRREHETLEMECRETYGFYAELLYKIESHSKAKETANNNSAGFKDLMSQREFMNFVCRSFATRLERRRNILITSLRFYRLVTDYFDRTTLVFESLVMGNKVEDFEAAAGNLQKLKDSQVGLEALEKELVKEGEKLSDMLSMPVKDALGRDLHIDYSDDIVNVKDILDTTIARRNIFIDSVELQKLTLEQVTHIHAYELDARMAIKWMDDLYNVMIKCHSHVGCNVHEIQVQKDELQTFQETGKSIYHYGCQLLEASQALRTSCKLDTEATKTMSNQLRSTWHNLQAISQEHMTRLRVSAVFHRSVEEYCNKLHDLKISVCSLGEIEESDCRRNRLRKYLALRERLLVEVGRMVRLGRLLKTRLKEPFVLDDAKGNVETTKSTTTMTTTTTTSGNSESVAPSAATESDAASSGAVVVATVATLIYPTGRNEMASSAITNKLTEIAEVAEALDAALRDTQNCLDLVEMNSNPSSTEKKLDSNHQHQHHSHNHNHNHHHHHSYNGGSNIEDWHSRSTEDESFATASEGNFTPHSNSSSYQTASECRTPSFLSSCKTSIDLSDLEDTNSQIFPLDMLSPGISYDGSSEPSFVSAQQSLTTSPQSVPADSGIDSTSEFKPSVEQKDDEGEDNRSRSATPTPENASTCKLLARNINESQTVIDRDVVQEESTTVSITNGHGMSSPSASNVAEQNEEEDESETAEAAESGAEEVSPSRSVCSTKPTDSWRSKYYGHVTKQTIKGCL